jgi:hypothetical protein
MATVSSGVSEQVTRNAMTLPVPVIGNKNHG